MVLRLFSVCSDLFVVSGMGDWYCVSLVLCLVGSGCLIKFMWWISSVFIMCLRCFMV